MNHKIKGFFILTFSLNVLLFISCIPYWDDGKVTGKTTIKNFEHLNDPLVIIADVTWEKTFLGLPCLDGVSYNRGNVFVVIDWETNTIFDWVYYPSNPGSVMKRAIELGTSPKKYYSSSYGGVVGCISPDSNKVTIYDTSDVFSYIEPCFLKGETAIMWHYRENYPLTACYFFDAKQGKLLEDKFLIDADVNIDHPLENDNGDLWIRFEDNTSHNTHVGKIDVINKNFKEFLEFKGYGTDTILGEKNGSLYMSGVISKKNNLFSLFKYNLQTGELLVRKDIPISDIDRGFFSNAYFYKEQFYVICFAMSSITNYYCVYVYQINTDTLEVERVSDRIDIWATENEWLRGSRIYFMYGNDSYTYFDLDTWQKAPYTYVMDYSTMTINPK